MSALEKTAAELASLQEHLEHAAARCTAAASHADDAHHAATAIGAATAIADAEDVKVAVRSLQQTLNRVATVAEMTADTIRTAIHGTPKPTRATQRPEVPAPIPGTP
jgi:predicted amino acid dehydrogenase